MPRATDARDGEKVITVNRKARRDYEILKTVEAGLVLTGSEVKSLRDGRVNLKDSFVRIQRGEAFLWNAHVAVYEAANRFGHEPERTRKLLLRREEIDELGGKVAERGLSLIPLRLYFRKGRAKVQIGLGRGRKAYDKRQAIRARELDREADRAMSASRKRGRNV